MSMLRPFVAREQEDVAAHLNTEFDAVYAAVQAALSEVRAGNFYLHGEGREANDGGVLSAGSGLSAHLTNVPYWIAGRRYLLAKETGYDVVAVQANADNYIYMDAAGLYHVYTSLQTPKPEGTWFVGVATANALVVTAVDQTDVEEVDSVAALAELVTAILAAVGWPYTGEFDIQTRLTDLESGNGTGGPVTLYWAALTESSGSPRKISKAIQDAMDQHLQDEHAGDSGTSDITVVNSRWDIEADNLSRYQLTMGEWFPDSLEDLVNAVYVIPGVTGGRFIDWENSTWVPEMPEGY